MRDYRNQLSKVVSHFWNIRDMQSKRQGSVSGRRDYGSRSAVTGGKQLDGFVELIRNIAVETGVKESSIHSRRSLELPGYYRPEKKWDLIIVEEKTLLAAIELKSHIGPSLATITTIELRRRSEMLRTFGPPTARVRSLYLSDRGWDT